MDTDKIIEKMETIKANIEKAFEKELIDFDEIENELSALIDILQEQKSATMPADKVVLNFGNYI